MERLSGHKGSPGADRVNRVCQLLNNLISLISITKNTLISVHSCLKCPAVFVLFYIRNFTIILCDQICGRKNLTKIKRKLYLLWWNILVFGKIIVLPS